MLKSQQFSTHPRSQRISLLLLCCCCCCVVVVVVAISAVVAVDGVVLCCVVLCCVVLCCVVLCCVVLCCVVLCCVVCSFYKASAQFKVIQRKAFRPYATIFIMSVSLFYEKGTEASHFQEMNKLRLILCGQNHVFK